MLPGRFQYPDSKKCAASIACGRDKPLDFSTLSKPGKLVKQPDRLATNKWCSPATSSGVFADERRTRDRVNIVTETM
jgi:hypothetical protein